MKSLKGTRDRKESFNSVCWGVAGQEQIHIFCFRCKKRRFEQISSIFLETAENEKEHAKRFFSALEGGDVEITAAYPAGSYRRYRLQS